MEKIISLDDTVYNICEKYPEIKDIMIDLGFRDITKTGMLNTAGRIMTIRKGAQMKKVSLESITSVFNSHGFIIRQ